MGTSSFAIPVAATGPALPGGASGERSSTHLGRESAMDTRPSQALGAAEDIATSYRSD